jgi:hypothetical protein
VKSHLQILVDTKQRYYVVFKSKGNRVVWIGADNVFHAYCIMFHYDKWFNGEDV